MLFLLFAPFIRTYVNNQTEQTFIQMAQLPCLILGLTPHAKHNVWVSSGNTAAG